MSGNFAIYGLALFGLCFAMAIALPLTWCAFDAKDRFPAAVGVILSIFLIISIMALTTLGKIADGRQSWRLTDNPDGSKTWHLVEAKP